MIMTHINVCYKVAKPSKLTQLYINNKVDPHDNKHLKLLIFLFIVTYLFAIYVLLHIIWFVLGKQNMLFFSL